MRNRISIRVEDCLKKTKLPKRYFGVPKGSDPIKKILRCIVKSIDNPLYIYIQAYTGIVCIPKALEKMEYIEKIIVLVEGTSDKDILEFAMLHLYPHLSDLFYFMDFDDENGEKREGGTPFVNKNFETF